ncbi:zinc-ribbon domain-containing protein [Nannocystis sp.]|uniref:zinc-ribbon domain-containing protein n=1 Tax=Nannocystis sp. TaxID=1962667 RepID=UPI0025FFD6C6|nr:zinc-ribbon domain-containing protein [Nannocystis sp.]MBK7828270.1 zinc-ribbon domain-containing protein [Nannocystis sp.]
MIIRCTKCSTEFALDPSQVGPEGVTLRCSVCSHMFHAEPDPDAVAAPWKLVTTDKHMFVLPDLRRVVEHVLDGRLRPEDQISRTGQSFIKLGDLPELSSLFIGAEGLPRVFRASEVSPAGELGPPPAFGGPADDVRREETVRFGMTGAGSGLRRPPVDDPLPAPPEFDTALPAPPEFAASRASGGAAGAAEDGALSRRGRAPGVPEPRSFSVPERSDGRAGGRNTPASMLEAVTKAVTGGDDRRDVPASESSKLRSQPILVADLARAAAASAEKAVQAVDGQRARERAERSTGTFTGAMTRVDPARPDPKTLRAEAPRPTAAAAMGSGRSGTTPVSMPAVQTAELRQAAAAARAAEQAALAAKAVRPEIAEPTQPTQPVDADEPGSAETGETAELTRPPEVVIVKMPEPGGRSSAPLWGLLGVVAAAGIVFGVPSLREKIFNLGGSAQGPKVDPKEARPSAPEQVSVQELEQARKAIRNLGFKESNKVQAALQRVIDDPARAPGAVAQARLTLAELVLMRALACKIAVMLEPAAMGGQAQTRSAEDPIAAQELLAALDDSVDADQLARVMALQALVEGKPTATLPADSEELVALVKGAALWRGELRTPPPGLLTSLLGLANPSTLSQSVLALALWRSGNVDDARTLLRKILDRVPDQPAAKTMLEALDRQDMLSENGDPEAAVPPSDPEPTPEPDPEPTTPPAVDPTPTPGDTKVAVVRPPGTPPAGAQEKVEVLISTGCQKVRQGDTQGVKMLLDAVDRGADPTQNFNLCFCLAAGFARQNNHDVAFSWYKRAVGVSPSNRDALAGAARSAELLGRTAVAVDYYKKLRMLDPGNAAAAAYLAKYDDSPPPPTPTPTDEPPGELMPIKPKNR